MFDLCAMATDQFERTRLTMNDSSTLSQSLIGLTARFWKHHEDIQNSMSQPYAALSGSLPSLPMVN
jgi:hypothetical protein